MVNTYTIMVDFFIRVMEIFTWLLEITEEAAEPYEDAKITWSARFEPQEDSEAGDSQRSESKKATTRLDIQKDDIQAVVPISKVTAFYFIKKWNGLKGQLSS